MSLEELQADFAANAETIKKLDANLTTNTELVNLIKYTIWPFQENVIKEMADMDAAIQDMVDGIDDVLHEETAGIIAAPIIAAKAIISQFKAMLPKDATEQLLAIKRWEKMAKTAEETINEIVVMAADEEEAPPDDEDEDGDDEDDDDEDEDGDEEKGSK